MKKITNKLRNIKLMIMRNIINYPILVYVIYYVIIIGIQIIFTYYTPIENITYNNTLTKTLPSVNVIRDYFSYKNIYLYKIYIIISSSAYIYRRIKDFIIIL